MILACKNRKRNPNIKNIEKFPRAQAFYIKTVLPFPVSMINTGWWFK
jgi:hypothetical protein